MAICTILACLSIHEFGHMAAAWLSGGAIGEVVLFSLRPHVQILGSATHLEEAFRAVAGSASSLIICFAFVLAGPVSGSGWQLVKDVATAFGCVELLGWSLSSISRTPSISPDDAELFLTASGYSPWIIIAACGMIAVAGILAFRISESRRNKHLITLHDEARALLTRSAAAGTLGGY